MTEESEEGKQKIPKPKVDIYEGMPGSWFKCYYEMAKASGMIARRMIEYEEKLAKEGGYEVDYEALARRVDPEGYEKKKQEQEKRNESCKLEADQLINSAYEEAERRIEEFSSEGKIIIEKLSLRLPALMPYIEAKVAEFNESKNGMAILISEGEKTAKIKLIFERK